VVHVSSDRRSILRDGANRHRSALAALLEEAPVLNIEQERWAEALAVQRIHGDAAPVFVAERIGSLALVGDEEGIRRWQEIALRLDRIISEEKGAAICGSTSRR
jgi:hypothetical protein